MPAFGLTAADFSRGLPAAVEETHISVVLLLGDRAVKIKKPIGLPFLDWTTLAARRKACHNEVELNRRLSPDVYLGVLDVVDEHGTTIEHLVVMDRMPAERRLRHLAEQGVDVTAGLDDLAALMARFHRGARRSPAITRAAGRDAVRHNWEDNLAVLHESEAGVVDPHVVARVDVLAHTYLAGRERLFAERGRRGLAVDGHGDLLADDIYLLDDGPRVLDCLEFSDELRSVDVLDDVAFLAMDLEHLGAPRLARSFLDAYRRHSGEHHPSSLEHHFIAYRAGVRAKVACVRSHQGSPSSCAQARDYLDIARSHLEKGRIRLVLMGGLPGTGKSTLATQVRDRTGWRLLRSDVVRKELAGIPPDQPMVAAYGEGLYTREYTNATYASLLDRAEELLARGESVILDASWTDAGWRERAEERAAATSSELIGLQCSAPAALAAHRLEHRPAGDASDATPAIAAAMHRHADPWPDALVVDTTASIEQSIAIVVDALDGTTAVP